MVPKKLQIERGKQEANNKDSKLKHTSIYASLTNHYTPNLSCLQLQVKTPEYRGLTSLGCIN